MTLNFPPRLPCQLAKVPHPGVNGTEPACLCRVRPQESQLETASAGRLPDLHGGCPWKEGWVGTGRNSVSPFLTIEKVSDALWKMRQLGECPLEDWQWMLEHSCQGLAWTSALGGAVLEKPRPSDGPSSAAFPGVWTGVSCQCLYAQSWVGAALQRIMPTAPSTLSACGKPGICEPREPLWSTHGSRWGCTALAEARGSWKLLWCGKLWLTWQGFPVYESMICVTPLN